ncbi:DUF742 domain-containing protein [Amycolatopsis alkalitolerans]|uniref:DUF742 domain-containing protein n=1 Tax=Amycolatopsis alkalitolerans TaxID=2547244 RepID=A0A5C4M5E6_9PSEU|nr:DUF742 domain-containing protein [Amycolatopsis alkalitolerans]TNC28276.1 DUF742 domain-containing protein [Amycolatopsis alkalitolerans]
MGRNAADPGSDPEEPRNALADEDWTKFRARVDREWRQRRADSAGDRDAVSGLAPGPGYGGSEYRVTDFGDRLLSGPGSELFGTRGDGGPPSGEFAGPGELSGYHAVAPGPGPASHPGPGYSGHPSLPSIPPVPATPPPPAPAETSGLVRPYFRTGGRTRPKYDLAIEALVSTSERGRVLDRVKVPEHRSICGLCLDTRSVAEVAAYLRLPLGVVRVLIGDVAGLGLVLVHTATAAVGDRPSIEFMERVLSGLRRI